MQTHYKHYLLLFSLAPCQLSSCWSPLWRCQLCSNHEAPNTWPHKQVFLFWSKGVCIFTPDARGDHGGDTGLGVDPVRGVPRLQQAVTRGVGEGVQHGDGAPPEGPLVQRLVAARTLQWRPDLKSKYLNVSKKRLSRSLTLSMDLSFIGESKIDPKEVLLSLRLDLEVGDVTSSLGMSGVRKHFTIRNSCREIFAC